MSHRALLLLVMIAGLVVSSPSSAQNWFVGGWIGYGEIDDLRIETGLGSIDSSFDGKPTFGFTYGYRFGLLRLEGDLARREDDVAAHRLDGNVLAGSKGSITNLSLTVNAILDILPKGSVSPYIGVGGGYSSVELDNFGVDAVPDILSEDSEDLGFQYMVGVFFRRPSGFEWDLQYRYLETSPSVTTSTAAGNVANDLDYASSLISIGLIYHFE